MAEQKANAYEFVRRWLGKWLEDGPFELAAALAYYTILSLGPMLLIAIVVAGAVFGEEAARGQVVRQIERVAGAQGAAVIESMIESAHKSHGSGLAAAIGVAVIFIGATGAFSEVKTALNKVWGLPKKPRNSGVWGFVKRRLLAFLLVLAAGVLLLVLTLVAAAASAAVSFVNIAPSSKLLLLAGDVLLSMAVMTVLFAAMYRLLPDCDIAGRDVRLGALVTAALFEFGILGIGVYLAHSAIASTYGAAGSVILVLVGIYYSALIFLLGAEFTNVYATSSESRASELAAPMSAGGGHDGAVSTGRQELTGGVPEATNSAVSSDRSWAKVGIATVASLALGALALKVRTSRLMTR